jgi:hypothetical protein
LLSFLEDIEKSIENVIGKGIPMKMNIDKNNNMMCPDKKRKKLFFQAISFPAKLFCTVARLTSSFLYSLFLGIVFDA